MVVFHSEAPSRSIIYCHGEVAFDIVRTAATYDIIIILPRRPKVSSHDSRAGSPPQHQKYTFCSTYSFANKRRRRRRRVQSVDIGQHR